MDKPEMKNTFFLVMGDPSSDGHGWTESVALHTDNSKEEIEAAFKLGASRIGFDITKICDEFEDNKISLEQLEILLKYNYEITSPEDAEGFYSCISESIAWIIKYKDESPKPLNSEIALANWLLLVEKIEEDVEEIYVGPDDFAHIYMFTVMMGNPDIRYILEKHNYKNQINIGGYGLFKR